jgi:hypothetical protein
MVVGVAKFICPNRIPRSSSSIVKGFARPRTVGSSRPCISLLTACATNLSVRSVHSQPLRILFCGADELSITSLEALCRESRESPSNVASIEVVCRPGKPTGRGLKQIRHRELIIIETSICADALQRLSRTPLRGWDFPSTKSIHLLGGR